MHKIVVGLITIFLLVVLWLAVDYFMTVTLVEGSISVNNVKLVEEKGRYVLVIDVYFEKKTQIPLISNPQVSVAVTVGGKTFISDKRVVEEKTSIEIPVGAEDVYWLVDYDNNVVNVTVSVSSLWGISRSLSFSVPFHVVFS